MTSATFATAKTSSLTEHPISHLTSTAPTAEPTLFLQTEEPTHD